MCWKGVTSIMANSHIELRLIKIQLCLTIGSYWSTYSKIMKLPHSTCKTRNAYLTWSMSRFQDNSIISLKRFTHNWLSTINNMQKTFSDWLWTVQIIKRVDPQEDARFLLLLFLKICICQHVLTHAWTFLVRTVAHEQIKRFIHSS